MTRLHMHVHQEGARNEHIAKRERGDSSEGQDEAGVYYSLSVGVGVVICVHNERARNDVGMYDRRARTYVT